ncbi:hypothetical protein DFQ26_008963 [Actinomortierella ambigua]|nr:hypothetical protein DFQ26_008963 [Actinomortierella ambigua]
MNSNGGASYSTPFLRRGHVIKIGIAVATLVFLASVSRFRGRGGVAMDEYGDIEPDNGGDASYQVLKKYHVAWYDPKTLHPPWTEADSSLLRTKLGKQVTDEVLRVNVTQRVDPVKSENSEDQDDFYPPDFLALTKRLRIHKALLRYLEPYYTELESQGRQEEFFTGPSSPELAPALEMLRKIEQVTFPWITSKFPSTFHLQDTFRKGGKGIVMCVGNYHVIFARSAVKILREVIKTTLPIEIYYMGEGDLAVNHRQWFEKFDNVKTIDILTKLDNTVPKLGGWAIKPFAILLSSFDEVLSMDADATFFEDPRILFDDAAYKETGTLYFYDRTLFPGVWGPRDWMRSFLPTMSNHPPKTRWFKLTGAHEQESGVVVIDKREHFAGLLAICKMNDRRERDHVTYRQSWGDKETFWIGLEMVQEPYAFTPYYGGVIGDFGDHGEKDRICGNQLHFMADGRPIWWNGGLLRDKYAKENVHYLKYQGYLYDEDGPWDFGTSCISPRRVDSIREMPWKERQKIFEYLKIDREVAVELSSPYKQVVDVPPLVQSDGAYGGKGNPGK